MTTFLNSVELKGFLGNDAEVKYTGNGNPVTTLSLATKSGSGRGDNRVFYTEWHKIVLWGQRATDAASLKKGAYLRVLGELRSSEYESKSGKVRTYEIVANKIEFPERPAKNFSTTLPIAPPPTPVAEPAAEPAPETAEPADAP